MKLRKWSAVAVGLVAVVMFSACRVEQGAAFFVGDERVSQNEFDDLVDDTVDQIIAGQHRELDTQIAGLTQAEAEQLAGQIAEQRDQADQFDQFASLRATVMENAILVELGRQVAADSGNVPTQRSIDELSGQFAEDAGWPADHPYVRLIAEAEIYRQRLQDAAPAGAEATRQWLTEQNPEAPAEQVDQAAGNADVQQLAGQYLQIAGYIDDYDVAANPRYGEVAILIANPLNQNQPLRVDVPDRA